MRGLDPKLKSARFANYVTVLRKEMLRLSRACGVCHPALVSSDRLEIINDRFQGTTVSELFGFDPSWGMPTPEEREQVEALMRDPGIMGKPVDAPTIDNTPVVRHEPTAWVTSKSASARSPTPAG
jgi:hypothetical protein